MRRYHIHERCVRRQQEVLQFVVAFKRAHDGNSPSIREIMDGCRIASTSLVAFYLAELEKRNKISLEPSDGRGSGKARRIEVIGGQWTFDARSA